MTELTSIAIKCHDLEAMTTFYREVFGGTFGEPMAFGPMRCRFGRVGQTTWKLVSGREAPPDFEGYPVHQLGLRVRDVEAAIQEALRHGGRAEGEVQRQGEQVLGCVRDPDGNTVELEQA